MAWSDFLSGEEDEVEDENPFANKNSEDLVSQWTELEDDERYELLLEIVKRVP